MAIVLWSLFLQIVAGILGLFLAQEYVPGVEFAGPFYIIPRNLSDLNAFLGTLVFVGALLGALNHFLKPLLKKITLPLRVITLDLFTLVILMLLVFAVKIFSPELEIHGLRALFLTALIVWGINFIISRWLPEKPKI